MITKTIIGVTPATAAALIKITVADGEGNKLLDEVALTDSLFTLTGTTYTATLKSTDNAAYAQYLVPDGVYTVTETMTAPEEYRLVTSTYEITAKTNVSKTAAVSGTGYEVGLTANEDTSTGRIDYTNEYEKPEEPHKKETSPYEGIGTLGAVKVGDEITYQIIYRNYKNQAADVTIVDKLDTHVEYVGHTPEDKGTYDETAHKVTWIFEDVAPMAEDGYVTLTVSVLESALLSNEGPGEVVNVCKKATVTVGNDTRYRKAYWK